MDKYKRVSDMDIRPVAMIFVALMLLLPGVVAMPRVPSEFRGWVIIDGEYAEDGTVITVLDSSGTVCGTSSVLDGYYGPLSCQGDDQATARDEGAELNEPLSFLVDGKEMNTRDAIKWKPAQAKEVNLLQGDIEKAGLLLVSQPSSLNPVSMLILSLVVVFSIFLVTLFALLLTKFIASRKKRARGLQGE